jgi:hypothetical protein
VRVVGKCMRVPRQYLKVFYSEQYCTCMTVQMEGIRKDTKGQYKLLVLDKSV